MQEIPFFWLYFPSVFNFSKEKLERGYLSIRILIFFQKENIILLVCFNITFKDYNDCNDWNVYAALRLPGIIFFFIYSNFLCSLMCVKSKFGYYFLSATRDEKIS